MLILILVVVLVPSVWLLGRLLQVWSVGRDDPLAECADRFDDDKTQLVDTEWRWLPPRWGCVYRDPDINHAVP